MMSNRVIPIKEISRYVNVVATQYSMTNNIDQNLLLAESVIRLAASKGGEIILLPELFSNLYFCQEQLDTSFSLALPNDINNNYILKKFKDLSKELNVCLPISFFEKANQAHYNSCVVFDSGKYLGIYRKSHIPNGPGYQEKQYFNPGDTGFRVFNTQFGTIGIGICWDQWFSETARILALNGAEMIFYPTAIGSEPHDPSINSRKHWTNAMKGHAACNLIPVIVSNRVGVENEITFYGGSFISDETGEIIHEFLNEQECGILMHKFDLNKLQQIRTSWGLFRDRRVDLYSPLLTLDGGSILKHNYSTGTGYNNSDDEINYVSKDMSELPIASDFYMPPEWHHHACCWMAFPFKKSIWSRTAVPAQKAVVEVAKAISQFEPVVLLVTAELLTKAKSDIGDSKNIKIALADYDDIWLRDTGPTFIINHDNETRGISWKFNGWGEKIENLSIEDTVSSQVLSLSNCKRYNCDAVLEGGSIHTDGEGTLITTEECVLNSNRSTSKFVNRTQDSLNTIFTNYLGIKKVIYLPLGVFGDHDTNGHVDNLCTFIRPAEVLLTFPEDQTSPQFPISKQAYDILINSTDAKGRKLVVHKIPHPPLLTSTRDDLENLEPYGDGTELIRKEGEVLAGSYINYYLANGEFGKGVVMPKFNVDTDIKAYNLMKKLFPDREVIMIEARDILLGGGNIHCITQQQPESI